MASPGRMLLAFPAQTPMVMRNTKNVLPPVCMDTIVIIVLPTAKIVISKVKQRGNAREGIAIRSGVCTIQSTAMILISNSKKIGNARVGSTQRCRNKGGKSGCGDMGLADIPFGESVVIGKKRHAEWIVCLSGVITIKIRDDTTLHKVCYRVSF